MTVLERLEAEVKAVASEDVAWPDERLDTEEEFAFVNDRCGVVTDLSHHLLALCTVLSRKCDALEAIEKLDEEDVDDAVRAEQTRISDVVDFLTGALWFDARIEHSELRLKTGMCMLKGRKIGWWLDDDDDVPTSPEDVPIMPDDFESTLFEEIRNELEALQPDNLIGPAMTEEEFAADVGEYGIVGEASESLKRLYSASLRFAQLVEFVNQRFGAMIESGNPYWVGAEACHRDRAKAAAKLFWVEATAEFPELLDHSGSSVLADWRLAWFEPHGCADCPARAACDERYGRRTSKEERHQRMEEDGWHPALEDLAEGPVVEMLRRLGMAVVVSVPAEADETLGGRGIDAALVEFDSEPERTECEESADEYDPFSENVDLSDLVDESDTTGEDEDDE